MANRLARVLAAIDAVNGNDPSTDETGVARALLYGRRMSEALANFAPQAPETRSFVAITDSPLAAAEQVLREVSNWRVAQGDASRAKSLR